MVIKNKDEASKLVAIIIILLFVFLLLSHFLMNGETIGPFEGYEGLMSIFRR